MKNILIIMAAMFVLAGCVTGRYGPRYHERMSPYGHQQPYERERGQVIHRDQGPPPHSQERQQPSHQEKKQDRRDRHQGYDRHDDHQGKSGDDNRRNRGDH